ncbi:hypothetical protein HNP33_003073 [Comamonas odontotermitis]|uniref:Uncharacterized protein n=1 Tax=Comamonas odontotermitis TaxID=379895 RepID=A0ABR6RIX0_9BURK|nr:hypothetical protein [Comamonas odontotermitis]MBB6578968.1 hypothetical protein [Comamonas odontotermitis]
MFELGATDKPGGSSGIQQRFQAMSCKGCFMQCAEGDKGDPVAVFMPHGIEAQVCADISARQAMGMKKYGKSVADNPLDLKQWLQHAYEETLDQAVYLKRAIKELEQSDGQRQTVDRSRDLGSKHVNSGGIEDADQREIEDGAMVVPGFGLVHVGVVGGQRAPGRPDSPIQGGPCNDVRLGGLLDCDQCRGTGLSRDERFFGLANRRCYRCGGSGRLPRPLAMPNLLPVGFVPNIKACPNGNACFCTGACRGIEVSHSFANQYWNKASRFWKEDEEPFVKYSVSRERT